MPETETEFTPVPEAEQLDADPKPTAGGDDTALDGTSGNDAGDLEQYKDRNGPVWAGPE